jgi:hypothetical protein
MTNSEILVCSSQADFLERLRDLLGDSWVLRSPRDQREALDILSKGRPHALFVSPQFHHPADADPLRLAFSLYPNLPAALIMPTDSGPCYSLLKSYGVGAAIPPDIGVSQAHARFFLRHVLDPSILNRLEEMTPAGAAVKGGRLPSPSIRLEDQAELLDDFRTVGYVDMSDLQLVFEEVVNNAIHHAFRRF